MTHSCVRGNGCFLIWIGPGVFFHPLQERFRIVGSPRNVNTTKEAIAIHRVSRTCQDRLHDQRLMLWLTTRLAVVLTWNNQGARNPSLNEQMKEPFFFAVELNISLHLFHFFSRVNPAYRPSRRLCQPRIVH